MKPKPYIVETNEWSQERYDNNILFNSEGVHQPTGHYKTNSADLQFEEIKPYLQNKRNAIDVGARWGSFTVQLHKFGFEHVYMAEMRDLHYPGIMYNVDMSRATLYPYPIMDKVSRVNRVGKTITNENYGNLTCYSVDSMKVENVDFIKIDVDGPDRLVLKGCKETIERCKPTIYIECGVEQIAWEKKMRGHELQKEDLIPAGYKAIQCTVEDNNMILVPDEM